MRSKIKFMNRGVKRKKQIHDWLNDVVIANNLLHFYNDIKILFAQGKDRESFNKFADLIDYLVSHYNTKSPVFKENGDILAYLIDRNIGIFGRTAVIIDLFNGTIKKMLAKRKEKIEIPKVIKGSDIKEIETEVKEEPKIVYGINTSGNKEKALHKVYIAKNGKPVHYLQSAETGRRLTQTETFKESVKSVHKTKKT